MADEVMFIHFSQGSAIEKLFEEVRNKKQVTCFGEEMGR